MSVLPDFVHVRPTSLDEALEAIDLDSTPYSGGTELLLAMRAGLLRPQALVDLKRIAELRSIGRVDGYLHIGGATTHQEVIDEPLMQEILPGLHKVLQNVGNPRVRSTGTLGGNLCFAEPKSDVATLLSALEASVELRSTERSRTVAVTEFVLGPYFTARQDDELLTAIRIPERDGRPVVYSKFQTMERPTLGVAAAITSEGRCRLVIGAVGGKPKTFEEDSADDLDVAVIADEVEVFPDLTGSDRYKRHIARLYMAEVLEELARAG